MVDRAAREAIPVGRVLAQRVYRDFPAGNPARIRYARRVALPEVCVCYLIRETPGGSQLLLGRKKTGLGLGKLVGPGGKLELGESPVDAVILEVQEEVGVTVRADSLALIGELTYPFPHRPAWSQKSWAFVCRGWAGVPRESGELRPEWHPLNTLPLDEMWDDAEHWLSAALAGQHVVATFTFAEDGNTVESTDWVSG